MTGVSPSIEQILSMLTEGPQRIAAFTAGLERARLHNAPNPGEWSANEVLAHMRSCSDMWGGCIERILAEDMPTIKAINPRTWIKSTDYPEQDFQDSLRVFTQQRAGLLALLERLAPEEWLRAATVKVAGNPYVRTVHFYANWLAIHERPHIKQIGRIVSATSV